MNKKILIVSLIVLLAVVGVSTYFYYQKQNEETQQAVQESEMRMKYPWRYADFSIPDPNLLVVLGQQISNATWLSPGEKRTEAAWIWNKYYFLHHKNTNNEQ